MGSAGRSDIIDIAGTVRDETDRAVLFYDGDRYAWLPKSLVEIDPAGGIALPEWLARERGLI